ncbi:MAG: 2Fe-2S iron-sulfur cluster binding domain-containing protein [Alphaproteobacteria bacterium]|nr:2Fe-2S iron-sulfur cluster binding domain-containing protein [Alphaproteobacteria bacterium]MDD9841168.1 2Fe-2S iron-sulfur cluster binding domain-containing protein [Alphaproteobacteria bacterium]
MIRGVFQIEIIDHDTHFSCAADNSVLAAMAQQQNTNWQTKRPIKIGCRNGGCGICKIHVVEGDYAHGKMSYAKVSEAERQAGYVLACRTFPRSDMKIKPAFSGDIAGFDNNDKNKNRE